MKNKRGSSRFKITYGQEYSAKLKMRHEIMYLVHWRVDFKEEASKNDEESAGIQIGKRMW